MRPAYRPTPRIYRGVRRRASAGRCPICERLVSVNPSGVRRSHRDTHGFLCPGSGVQIADRPVRDFDIDAAHRALAEREAEAKRHPPAAEVAAPTRRQDPPPGRCPECGQNPRLNKDGTLRAHRMKPDTFAGPYCPGGRPKGPQ